MDTIDALPGGVGWNLRTIHLKGDLKDEDENELTEEMELWFRDPVECIKELMGNPVFKDVMRYAPEKMYSDKEGKEPIVNEMWTAEWWWKLQVS